MTSAYNLAPAPTEPPPKKGGFGVMLAISVPVVILGVLFATGLLPRIAGEKELKKAHLETVDAIPTVRTIAARPASQTEAISLPGNVGAIQYTTIYARVNGYLGSRLVDIGDHVTKGQLLAVIETPTIDAELQQAKADLAKVKADLMSAKSEFKEALAKEQTARAEVVKAKANVAFASITAQRWIDLCSKGAVSQQSRDEKVRSRDTTAAELGANEANVKAAVAQVLVAQSNVEAQEAAVVAKVADVTRVGAKQSFQKVLAPFDGVITLRKVDPGALITEGSSNSNTELYQMARIDRLRIYVGVPQRVARYLHADMKAVVNVPEYPDRKFEGTVTNVSGALDPNTRTRQTEIQVDNQEHHLLPGMYAEVQISDLRETPWIRIAGTCVVSRTNGQFVVVVKDGKAHFQQITIGRDFGDEVEIKTGLDGGEQVIVSPNDDLQEGDQVHDTPATNQT